MRAGASPNIDLLSVVVSVSAPDQVCSCPFKAYMRYFVLSKICVAIAVFCHSPLSCQSHETLQISAAVTLKRSYDTTPVSRKEGYGMQFLVTLEGVVSPAAVERLAAVVEAGAGRVVSFVPSNTLHILLPREMLHTLHSCPGPLSSHSPPMHWPHRLSHSLQTRHCVTLSCFKNCPPAFQGA